MITLLALSTTREIRSQIIAAEQDYETIKSDNIVTNEKFTKADFFWGLGIVKARSFDMDGKLVLIPGIFHHLC